MRRGEGNSVSSHCVSFPGLEGARGVSPAPSDKQAAGCFPQLLMSFRSVAPERGFSQK